jgi:hypothetical protein
MPQTTATAQKVQSGKPVKRTGKLLVLALKDIGSAPGVDRDSCPGNFEITDGGRHQPELTVNQAWRSDWH